MVNLWFGSGRGDLRWRGTGKVFIEVHLIGAVIKMGVGSRFGDDTLQGSIKKRFVVFNWIVDRQLIGVTKWENRDGLAEEF